MEVNYIYKFISGIHKKHNSIGVMEGRFLGALGGGGAGDMWIPFQSKKEVFVVSSRHGEDRNRHLATIKNINKNKV